MTEDETLAGSRWAKLEAGRQLGGFGNKMSLERDREPGKGAGWPRARGRRGISLPAHL